MYKERIKRSYRQVVDRNFIFVFFCLKFIHQFHHWATRDRERDRKQSGPGWSHTDSTLPRLQVRYLGFRKSKTTLYSLHRECRRRKLQPMITPSRLPNTLSTSQGKIRWSSCTHKSSSRSKPCGAHGGTPPPPSDSEGKHKNSG